MKPRYSNDRKAPRMKKARFSKAVITKELWIKFITTFPEYKDMKWEEFCNNWSDITEKIRKHTITNPLGIKLGSYLGELKLQYLPHKYKPIDQKVSNELGENTNHPVINTRGKVGKIKWERRWAVKFNKILQFYAFDETRELHRMAKAHIDVYPASLRISRNTLGGHSIWRQKRKV